MALTVAFDGLPGSGKTTVIGLIAHDLKNRGFDVEIADIETVGHARIIRPITKTFPLGHPARILLFWVLRLEQYERMLKTAADIVLLDRFWGSTLAYDLYGNKIPQEAIEWLKQYLERQPDITLFFDAPLSVVRLRKEAKTMSDLAFARRVEGGYKELAQKLSWTRVDATEEPEEVKRHCLEAILPRLIK